MGNKMKIFCYALSAFAVLLIAASAAVVFKYRQCVAANEPPSIAAPAKITPVGDKRLGDNIEVSAFVKCAWDKKPVGIVYNPPKGLKAAGVPKISIDKLRFGYAGWKVVLSLIPYRNGDIAASSFEITFDDSKNGENSKNVSVSIPAFKVLPLNVTDANLAVASKINAPGHPWRTAAIAGIAVLMLALLIYYFFFRKKAAARVIITPWGSALLELCELRQKMKSGRISIEACVSSLTDIVRVYLEKRFRLHATAQTTYEFLQDMERPGSPLSDGHRGFLRDFLTSADLVKFANLPADAKLFDDAAEKAERLVCETKPIEENMENKK